MLVQLQNKYPDDVRLVLRHFPLSYHENATPAAQAAEAAGIQGKFFEMKAQIFENTSEWAELTPADFEKWAIEKAELLGLDVAQFTQDYSSPEVAERINDDLASGRDAGVGGTPSVYINGSKYEGQLSPDIFEAIVQLFQMKDIQYSECPPMTIDPDKEYTATIQTEKGDIVIELLVDAAPLTVNSFVFLANEGWFDGVIFHRVIPGFVAQTGDPTGKGFGGPGYAFDNEVSSELLFEGPGIVGMANSGENTNGSQFFITFDSVPDLNGGYTIFGRVIEGMEVVESITERDPSLGGELPEGDKIITVVIEEK
ncbi:MAG: peptidylprolyl isomerase [Anaerolineaceae bacterium]|nr:peptidylprolyl isomerase [Anaerolineaceae bacterium]